MITDWQASLITRGVFINQCRLCCIFIFCAKFSRPAPMGPTQLLLRGAKLRNTHHANGIVVYTGLESKLMKNAHRPPLKMSQLERVANKQVSSMLWVDCFIIIVIIAFLHWNKPDTARRSAPAFQFVLTNSPRITIGWSMNSIKSHEHVAMHCEIMIKNGKSKVLRKSLANNSGLTYLN